MEANSELLEGVTTFEKSGQIRIVQENAGSISEKSLLMDFLFSLSRLSC